MLLTYQDPMGKRKAINTDHITKVLEDADTNGDWGLTVHLVGGQVAVIKGLSLEDLEEIINGYC